MEEEQRRPLWRFESLSSFRPPPASISEATRTGLRGLLDRLRDPTHLRDREKPQDTLERLSSEELDRLIPRPPVDRLAEALAQALEPWPKLASRMPTRLVVHPEPGLGAEAVDALARAWRWPVIEPPALETLLEPNNRPVSELLPGADESCAMPRLGRWFLRHPHALSAMRELLSALALRRAPTLLACGSWAYAWLCDALEAGTVFPEPVALAALDAEALGSWLGSSVDGPLACREQNGGWVLSTGDGDRAKDRSERSSFLRHLAAEARGNANVASGLWALALRRAAPDARESASGATADVMVVPWSRLVRPSLGRRARAEEIAVLHALLLHGPLPLDVLQRTLPFPGPTLRRALAACAATGLLEAEAGQWRIAPAGQPAVRRELIDAGHPADDF
jgi:hypothetical protein